MAKNLTDLTARIATAGSDLLHINSGGTDYKQTKSNFMHGSLAQNFEVTSTLTSQVDALPIEATYFGCLWNYGHVSVTGMPINALSYVRAVRANSDQFAFIEVWSALDPDGQHYIICKSNGTWQSSWTKCASKAEITYLNTITPVSMTAGPNFTIDVNNSYRMGNLIIVYVKGHLSGTGSLLFTLSNVSGTVRNGSNTFAVGTGDAWSISGSGYCYFNETRKDFSTTLSSGYLHIHYVILIS